MKPTLAGTLVLLFSVSAHSDQPELADFVVAESESPNGLVVRGSSVSHIHAELPAPHNIGFVADFDPVEDSGTSLIYMLQTRAPILKATTKQGKTTVQYGSEASMVVLQQRRPLSSLQHHQLIAGMRSIQKWGPQIRVLSESLGQQGLHGKRRPVTLWLHRIAQQLAPDKPSQTSQMLQTSSLQSESMWPFTEGTKHDTSPFSVEPVAKCGNPAFGMCGPGDTCWESVCGDCKSHRGCWEHDCYCSCCGMTNPRCISMMATSATCNYPSCAEDYCEQTDVQTECECVF